MPLPAGITAQMLRDFLAQGNTVASGGRMPDASNPANLQSSLDFIKNFDPNASIVSNFAPGQDTGGAAPSYRVNYDINDLPKTASGLGPQEGGQTWIYGAGPLERSGVETLANPNATWQDPIYGLMTNQSNININEKRNQAQQNQSGGLLSTIGNMITPKGPGDVLLGGLFGGLASMGIPGWITALGKTAASELAGGTSQNQMGQLMSLLTNLLRGGANG